MPTVITPQNQNYTYTTSLKLSAGMVLNVKKPFRTLAGYTYLVSDSLLLIRKTYAGQYGRLCSNGNWIVEDRHWISEWSSIESLVILGTLAMTLKHLHNV
jgi:hypothetical protein